MRLVLGLKALSDSSLNVPALRMGDAQETAPFPVYLARKALTGPMSPFATALESGRRLSTALQSAAAREFATYLPVQKVGEAEAAIDAAM